MRAESRCGSDWSRALYWLVTTAHYALWLSGGNRTVHSPPPSHIGFHKGMEALRSSGSALKELPQRRSVISPTLRLLSEWPHSSMSLCRSGRPYRENHHWSLCLLRGSPSPIFPNIFSFPPLLALPCLATPAGVFGTPPLWDSPPLSAADTPFFCPHTFISPV